MDIDISFNREEYPNQDFNYLHMHNVQLHPYDFRNGAIDLLSAIEFTIASIAGGIIYDYLKGVTGFNLAERLGNISKDYLVEFRDTMKQIYNKHCSTNLNYERAFAYVEHFIGLSIYAVLNHSRSSEGLVAKLGNSLLEVYSLIPFFTKLFPEGIHTLQIYPDFYKDEWRYVFIPSTQAFGRYIDRVFDMKIHEFLYFQSCKEFRDKFSPSIDDKYKFIIAFERDL